MSDDTPTPPPEDPAALEAILGTLHPETSQTETFLPPSEDGDGDEAAHAAALVAALGELPELCFAGEGAEFEPIRSLGGGGMGVVELARHRVLGREVAVKSLRGQPSLRDRVQILREAWVTGHLEHPNIVPLYQVGVDERGNPILILKRVSGTSLAELLAQPDHPAWPDGIYDRQEWSLRVLIQICAAVHSAHARHLLHRDIKPANIMIGSFGEVFLMDWGVAVGLDAELADYVALARDVDAIVGTPAYMAPEQVEPSRGLGVATDVYLLGAVLHEILTGRPPHAAANAEDSMRSALRSRPFAYDASVPDELAEIAHRAMHPRSEARYDSADALGRALETCLERRSSILLTSASEARLALATELFVDDEALGPLLSECRFGFAQARREWPDNPRAREGLLVTLELMLDRELYRHNVPAAEGILEELSMFSDAWDAHRERVEALAASVREEVEHVAALERKERERSVSYGAGQRSRLILIMASFWATLPTVVGTLDLIGAYELSHRSLLSSAVAFTLFAAACGVLGRKTLFKSDVTRNTLIAITMVGVAMTVLRLEGWALGFHPYTSVILTTLLFTLTAALMTLTLDRWMIVMVIPFALAHLISFFWPAGAFFMTGLGITVAFVSIALIWRRLEGRESSD